MQNIILRPYQQECIDLIDTLQPGAYVLQLPTGCGKTVVFSHIKRHGKMLILSHRDELVKQPIKYFDCPCGIEQGQNHSQGEEVVSASVMSLHRRLARFDPYEFDILITDECHHAAATTYRKIYDYFNPRLHLGFTATPNRGDHVRLDNIYSDIIFQKDILWAIQEGYLCNINCLRVDIGYDIRNVRIKKGDFDEQELSLKLNQQEANERIARAYEEYAKGQTLIFAVSIAHAENIAKQIPGSVVVTASTNNRSQILQDFADKKFRCLINVMLFTEGTDIPCIETIMIARPTRNTTLYTQMVGRGMRLYPGKNMLTLIDCVGTAEVNDLCTAPSLLGIDMQQVPQSKQMLVSGTLTDLTDTVTRLIDNSPEAWILNCHQLDLFFKKNSYDSYGVRYTLAADGSLLCSLKDHTTIKISAPDQLGHSYCVYYRDYPSDKRFFKQTQKMPIQDILKKVRNFLEQNHKSEDILWDVAKAQNWGKRPATAKQKTYIQNLWQMPVNKQYDFSDLDINSLTREEAGIIIDRLKAVLSL